MKNIDVTQMTISEVINTAIYNEKLASDFYINIANMLRKIDNTACADFFEDQAAREEGHYNSLFKYKTKVEGDVSQPVGEGIKWVTQETGAGQDVRADISIDDALQLVEEREDGAEKFYRQAAENCDDKELCELFTKIAKDEAYHHYLIQKLRSAYEQKGVIEPPDYDELGYAG